ncbi:transcriptional regulator, AfsR/DnrI/RedD family [Vulgatibacter incomptus]|uniref:Transcriptional regulator, AfsR/DnrI/RedD family n=2 Tax=Vulgatibacter incomptus TaxID=1391653 RepID=A0A0K1PI81_9BACT|nr:transcriptional regulator, AfsR/DnrI/RedD family [Vulgatibacter incomptus]
MVELERKTAALLAVLAVDGPTSRSRIAGLLWPDSDEARARANLRQALSRLRKLTNVDLVDAGDPLQLADGVDVDLRDLRRTLLGGALPNESLRSTILTGQDFSDCDELASWIEGASTDLGRLVLASLEREADRLEKDERPLQAVPLAERLIARDPYSERAHRRLIRLHYLAGDRAAALRAFERARRTLLDELGVEPDPETLALARLVERGTLPGSAGTAREIPPSLRRPPRLVGREKHWARMQAAWDEEKVVFVTGPAGVGKSRLARDFAAAQGVTPIVLASRPGDAGLPFASQARAVRQILAAFPEIELPRWLRRELSRMLPELLEAGEEALPPLEEADMLRFLQAQLELLRRIDLPYFNMVVDDLHHCDPASATIGPFVTSNPAAIGAGRKFRLVVVFRPSELDETPRDVADKMVREGIAVSVELEPLPDFALAQIVRDLDLGVSEALGADLVRAAGGSPALLLELVKSLFHDGALEDEQSARAALSEKLEVLSRPPFGR